MQILQLQPGRLSKLKLACLFFVFSFSFLVMVVRRGNESVKYGTIKFQSNLENQVLVNGSRQGGLGDSPDDALFLLSVLEKQHGGNAPNPTLRSDVGAVISVELETGNLAGVLPGQFVDHRCDHPAWSAPWRPELH